VRTILLDGFLSSAEDEDRAFFFAWIYPEVERARSNLSDLATLGHLENKLSDSHAFVRHFIPAKAALCLSPVRRGF